MKIVKRITLFISIVFPIAITIFLGFYSYGTIGGWTINQTKFKETIFNDSDPTPQRIEEYVKFSSSHYANHTSNLNVWEDHATSYSELKKIQPNSDSSFSAYENAFKVKVYTMANNDEEYLGISTRFMLYDINYGLVDPANLYFICVQGSSKSASDTIEEYDSFNSLKEAIDQFAEDYKEYNTTSYATDKHKHSSASTPLFDKDAVLDEDMSEDSILYVYSFAPTGDYPLYDENGDKVADQNNFNRLGSASFAIIEINSNGKNEGATRVWFTGEITSIESDVDKFIEKAYATTGYGSLEPQNLYNAGYNKYMLPKLIIQSVISLIVAGLLSYLFYATWTVEEDLNKNPAKKKE